MADLFADENVPAALAKALGDRGYDVLTAVAAGRANQRIPDRAVLLHASSLARAVLTNDRRHFHRLHAQIPNHAGIITFTDDPDTDGLAQRIDDAIRAAGSLAGKLVKITRPP